VAALGKENFQKKIKALCRVPSGLALGKEFFLKKKLCRVHGGLALGKENSQKKNKSSLPSASRVGTRQRKF